MASGDPKDGDGVVAVYSTGSRERKQSCWYMGEVSLANGYPVACFPDEYNLGMVLGKRLRSLSVAGTAGPGTWCIIKRAFP